MPELSEKTSGMDGVKTVQPEETDLNVRWKTVDREELWPGNHEEKNKPIK